MKKWLIGCLTVLAMVCLIPGIALNAKAAAETTTVVCNECERLEIRRVLGYEKYDSTDHKVLVDECSFCHKDGDVIYIRAHTGGSRSLTCTKGKICEKCGEEYDILGHDWDVWRPISNMNMHGHTCTRCYYYETAFCGGDSNATCITQGTCETCGGSYYGGHDWGAWTSDGDGTHGTHTRRCTRCDTVETADCIGGTATCTAKAVCIKCGKPYGDLAPHMLVTYKRQATCQQEGLEYTRCTAEGCNFRTPDIITPKQHDLKKAREFTRKPTCTKPGWNSWYLCRDCAYSETDWIDKLGHDWEQHAAKAPTCTEKGWNAYDTCSRCNYTTTYQELPALNHNLVQHEAKAPTCTEIGWDAYEACSRGDYTTRKELPALNHDLKQYAAKAPTCTEIGWDAYEGCTRSGCNYTTYHVLPALNHDLEQHDAKAPTCTEIGWNAYDTCKNCNDTTYTELPALNHDYQAVTVEPTCETDGYTIFTCSRCKDSYTVDPTDKLGHKFGAWSPNGTGSQSAGCLRQGCAHIGITDCRKFTFRTAEGETLTFCPVCGQAENAAQLEKIEAATAWAISGSLSAEDVTARTNGEYLSVAFETAGSLTQPTGRVRLALPAGLREGKKLVRIAPDGTQTELPFEAKNGRLIFTLDFANSELPVMFFRLVPQTTVL